MAIWIGLDDNTDTKVENSGSGCFEIKVACKTNNYKERFALSYGYLVVKDWKQEINVHCVLFFGNELHDHRYQLWHA